MFAVRRSFIFSSLQSGNINENLFCFNCKSPNAINTLFWDLARPCYDSLFTYVLNFYDIVRHLNFYEFKTVLHEWHHYNSVQRAWYVFSVYKLTFLTDIKFAAVLEIFCTWFRHKGASRLRDLWMTKRAAVIKLFNLLYRC